MFAALRDLMGVRHDAMYVQLLRKADGVAIGRTAMPHLPSSRRQGPFITLPLMGLHRQPKAGTETSPEGAR